MWICIVLPETNGLILVGQLVTITTIKVIGLCHACGRAIEVLNTSLGCKILEVARVLSCLQQTRREKATLSYSCLQIIYVMAIIFTLILHALVGIVVPTAVLPKTKFKLLQFGSRMSTYTKVKYCFDICKYTLYLIAFNNILCSPELTPHMVGGLMPPPALATEKVSVAH